MAMGEFNVPAYQEEDKPTNANLILSALASHLNRMSVVKQQEDAAKERKAGLIAQAMGQTNATPEQIMSGIDVGTMTPNERMGATRQLAQEIPTDLGLQGPAVPRPSPAVTDFRAGLEALRMPRNKSVEEKVKVESSKPRRSPGGAKPMDAGSALNAVQDDIRAGKQSWAGKMDKFTESDLPQLLPSIKAKLGRDLTKTDLEVIKNNLRRSAGSGVRG